MLAANIIEVLIIFALRLNFIRANKRKALQRAALEAEVDEDGNHDLKGVTENSTAFADLTDFENVSERLQAVPAPKARLLELTYLTSFSFLFSSPSAYPFFGSVLYLSRSSEATRSKLTSSLLSPAPSSFVYVY